MCRHARDSRIRTGFGTGFAGKSPWKQCCRRLVSTADLFDDLFGDTQSQTGALGGSAVVRERELLPDGSDVIIGRTQEPQPTFPGGAFVNKALLSTAVLPLTCNPTHAFDSTGKVPTTATGGPIRMTGTGRDPGDGPAIIQETWR